MRFGFALVWAVLLVLNASSISPLTAVLLVIYPLFDVAAAVVDLRSSRATATGAAAGPYATVALGALAAIGLAVAVTSGVPAVLRVWGVWAVVAGGVQLAVALRRRGLGGRWAMIASGSLSVLAGASFVVMASSATGSLAGIAGYALLGGVFFLVSALRLGRDAGRS
ncbi:hypothetical protein [Pseudonocardia abyssalis]|uniref:hypothetical protein n=1 Tax=Pseudonocardia abyssalis TaxID=2792008 RepID=UPI003FD6E0FA